MRIDHVAYQQASRVAGYGLGIQAGIGLAMIVLGVVGRSVDTSLLWASAYPLIGTLVWLSLLVVFHQHKLERLEALEADELAQSRGTTIFDREILATRVAARRLELMHRWLMPAASLVVAGALAVCGVVFIRRLNDPGSPESPFVFEVTDNLAWAMAVCLVLALIAFIFSRFVAGMAKQPAWQNLRGGAGYMVGNALVCLALAAGFGFQYAQQSAVLPAVTYGIAIFMVALAAEIVLNFILNLYRPRRVGETPRPAFDSRILSLLAAPDSIVRSINEAVNYQFGFDITSSWGYQLLLRSVGALVLVGAAVMLGLSCLVTVEQDQRAVRLRFGRIVEVHGPGLMFKLPWPIETAELHEVGRVRPLSLAVNPVPNRPPPAQRVSSWVIEDTTAGDRRLFVTGASRLAAAQSGASSLTSGSRGGGRQPDAAPTAGPSPSGESREAGLDEAAEALLADPLQFAAPGLLTPPEPVDAAAEAVASQVALVDAEVVVLYRVRPDELRKYLEFASESRGRRTGRTMRERAMRAIALRELSAYFQSLSLEDVLSPGRSGILDDLRQRIQARFDDPAVDIGVDVVAVTVPLLRPPYGAAAMFEEFTISVQANRQALDIAQQRADVTMAVLVSGSANAEEIVRQIERLATVPSTEPQRIAEESQSIEESILRTRGSAAADIERAEAVRWTVQMQARADVNRLEGDLPLYRAAPELFKQRHLMRVLSQTIPLVRSRYFLALPADRVRFDVEMLQADAGLNFMDAIEAEQGRKVPGSEPETR